MSDTTERSIGKMMYETMRRAEERHIVRWSVESLYRAMGMRPARLSFKRRAVGEYTQLW